jgi:hypothetical protein
METRIKKENLERNDLQDTMTNQYRIATSKAVTSKEDHEVGLFGGEEKVMCYNCNKMGHKAFQCIAEGKEGKKGSKKKCTGKCDTWGKVGHNPETCWTDPANADKVPDWLKIKAKKKADGSAETGLAGVEVLLTSTTVEIQDEVARDQDGTRLFGSVEGCPCAFG